MEQIPKTRLEAFSDGVIAIIITIMVLELKAPHDGTWPALAALLPVFLSYVLSFAVVAVLWVNHHHLLHTLHGVSGRILWLNLHMLFWLSLVPFTTAYMGENHLLPMAVALYGLNMFLSGLSFDLLRRAIAGQGGADPVMAGVHRRSNRRNAFTMALYVASIPLAWVSVWLSVAIFVFVPLVYFMPGRTIERLSGSAVPHDPHPRRP